MLKGRWGEIQTPNLQHTNVQLSAYHILPQTVGCGLAAELLGMLLKFSSSQLLIQGTACSPYNWFAQILIHEFEQMA
jgi:hypothetical protein